MFDISAGGMSDIIRASETFPSGFVFTDYADDADPFDVPAVTIAESAMNANGQLVTWSSPQPVNLTINAIPGSPGDENLQIIFEANRSANGKRIAMDEITIVHTYANGSTSTFSRGKMISGSPGMSSASGGRHKSKAYTFVFEGFQYVRGNNQNG